MTSSPIVITLAAKLFWAMAGNGPSAQELDKVIYPLVESIGTPMGPDTYAQLIDRIASHFGRAPWVFEAGIAVQSDCRLFTGKEDCFETPTGKTFPLGWVNLT